MNNPGGFINLKFSLIALMEMTSDDELSAIHLAARAEIDKRLNNRIDAGLYAPLTVGEFRMARNRPIDAIKMYKDRMGVGVMEAKAVVDRCLELHSIIEHPAA
jgi:hypothetical protein